MENINQQVVEIERKVSLLSNHEFSRPCNEKVGVQQHPPEDKHHLLHFIFFFLAFGSIVPMSFFLTANDYWMYKFRDINQPFDAKHRTTLQKNFLSTTSIIQSVPSILTNILTSLYGHKINLRKRFLSTLAIITLFFLTYTVFIDIDTDSWQLGFFILTMVVSFFKSIVGTFFGISNMALTSRFPPTYMKTGMYGSVAAMLFSSTLQILCLKIGGSSIQVAQIYFYIGSIIAVLTLIVAYCTKYSALFNYYQGDLEADTKKPLPSFAQIKMVYERMKPFILVHIVGALTMGTASSGITTMITSEYYKKDDEWTDKYFVPVTCYLIPGVSGLIGRVLARPILTKKNIKWWIVASLFMSYCLLPLYMFCNSPKNHFPVLFPHDWQYITLHIITGIGGGYLGTISFLSMQKFAGDMAELSFLTMTTLGAITMSALSPLTSVWVNIM